MGGVLTNVLDDSRHAPDRSAPAVPRGLCQAFTLLNRSMSVIGCIVEG